MGVFQYLAALLLLATLSESAEWSYDPDNEYGPSHWDDINELCGGRVQSPINIDTTEAVAASFEPFEFQGYQTGQEDSGTVTHMQNNGHTVTMFFDEGGFYGLSGGGLTGEYEALQAHFHWGVTDDVGSEHTVDDNQFPLEMHIVHYAYERYNGSIGDALYSEEHDALAVLGVLFEIGNEDNEAFEEVITGVANVEGPSAEYLFQNEISMYDLLPEDKSTFYRYNGSLTTPDCFQVIAWTVFAKPVEISSDQIQRFRDLTTTGANNETKLIGNTFRPTQDLYGRTVYCASGIPGFTASMTIIVIMAILNMIMNN